MNKNKGNIPEERLQKFKTTFDNIKSEYSKNIVGQDGLFLRLMVALITQGHILLEGVPGLAKTRSINVLSQAVQLTFNRIQFTPDLLPSDIVGNLIFNPKDAKYYTKTGPIFANLILADEINRAPAKVQSALLEAMQERQVTIGGTSYKLPKPFMVLATQNPIEQEGTFALPEAQVDRFLLKTVITYPSLEDEVKILDLIEHESDMKVQKIVAEKDITDIQKMVNEVYIAPELKKYIANLIYATRRPKNYGMERLSPVISFGASPRGAIAFMKVAKVLALIQGRGYVIPEDIKDFRQDILRHRVILTFEAEADGVRREQVIEDIFNTVKVP